MADKVAETRHGSQAAPVATAGLKSGAGVTPLAAWGAATVLAGSLLASCSSTSGTSFSLFADPGKYEYYTCVQIAGDMKNWTNRQKELKSLMDRAEQSAGGSAVGFIAYKGDYVAASEEVELLQAAARNKSCDQDPAWRSNTAIR
jgi:hypothetical protein